VRKRYVSSIEIIVEVDVEGSGDEAATQVRETINREVVAVMPSMVVGAWVTYAEPYKGSENR